ncbi:putative Ig domain-containing protein [Actinocrinis puniceicyclus]|nr:putative Ig domain-containing protein [Actinocrinis puniceicyclus]
MTHRLINHSARPPGRAVATLSALALTATAVVAAASLPAHAATATLVVNANQPFRSVTHVATGSLYGLASGTVPADSLVEPIHPNTFVQMPAGGHQQPTGDILKVAPEAERAGAKLVDRLSDYYAGWPYQFSWSTWPNAVSSQIQQVKAANLTDLASWELWNEPDNTWRSSNGTFESFWTRTYNQVRSLDKTTPIQGPSFSDNISDMQNFLKNAVATNTVPDIIAWHELESSSKIAGDVSTVTNLERSLGITPRPIAIEEYAAPSQVGIPGALVGYIAQFERLGVNNAELAFWNQSGALGDLLTGQGGSPNGAYWLYTWYAAMSGSMVTTVPASGLDGAASVNAAANQVNVIFGGGSGSTAVTVNGLSSLSGFSGNSQVNVTLQYTPSPGRTVAVSAPTTVSQGRYTVSNGSITVPISSMSSTYGYHLIVTPVSPSGNTVTVSNPGNQTGTVGTAISGLQMNATDSASGQTLTYSASGLPAGLSISSSGLISGTPTASGTFNVTVTAKDGTGASGSASFTWTIGTGSSGNTVTVTNPGAQSGTVGTAISALQVQATDSGSGQTLTYSASGLPAGLSISSSGLISGTPTASGTFNVTVTAKDGTGASGSASFTWTIGTGSTGGGTCQVSYVKNEWGGGFTANLTVTNTGTSTINGWTVTWSFPGDQKVTNAWNANVTQSGSAVTATNMSYNPTIAPGGNVQFGFQGTWAGNDTSPSAFTLNGNACS